MAIKKLGLLATAAFCMLFVTPYAQAAGCTNKPPAGYALNTNCSTRAADTNYSFDQAIANVSAGNQNTTLAKLMRGEAYLPSNIDNSLASKTLDLTSLAGQSLARSWGLGAGYGQAKVRELNLTAAEQVELIGWISGADAAKALAAQFQKDGVKSTTTNTQMNIAEASTLGCKGLGAGGVYITCSYTTPTGSTYRSSDYSGTLLGAFGLDYKGVVDAYGQTTAIVAAHAGETVSDVLIGKANDAVKSNVTGLLAKATGLPDYRLNQLPKDQYEALAQKYLGIDVAKAQQDAIAGLSDKLGFDVTTDLAGMDQAEVMKKLGATYFNGAFTADNAAGQLIPQLQCSRSGPEGSTSYMCSGESMLQNTISDSFAESTGIDPDQFKGMSGEELSDALGVNTDDLDFSFDEYDLSSDEGVEDAIGSIVNVDSDAMGDFQSGGSFGSWGGGSTFSGGSSGGWRIM